MSVQNAANLSTVPFIRSGNSLVKDNETLLQDAGRGAVALAPFTVMAQVAATKKWVPYTDIAAVDGSGLAKGVYLGDSITGAAIVAGDVLGLLILVGAACTVDSDQLVFENSLTLDTVVQAAAIDAHRVEDDLANIGIFAEDTVDIDGFENA